MPITAQIEGIGNLEFPDGTSPDVIHQTVQKVVMQHNAPASLSGPIGSPSDNGVPTGLQGPAAPAPKPHGSKLSDISNTDVAKGLGETLAQNVASGGHMMGKLPVIGKLLAPQDEQQYWQDLAKPENSDQALGKTVGDVGENVALTFAAPEFEGVGLLPSLGRIGTQAAVQGGVSKLQGGSNKDALEASALGAGGGVLGEIGRAIAPTIAETAIGIKGADRSYGAKPGESLLKHTTGFTPRAVTASAEDAIDQAVNTQRALAAGSPTTVNLGRAADEAVRQTTRLQDQLFRDPSAKLVEDRLVNPFGKLPQLNAVPLPEALPVRSGIGSLSKWNELQPGTQDLSAASKPVYRMVTDAIHGAPDVGPQIQDQDRIIHSLLPVVDRANAADLNANLLQRAFGRLGAHTGAALSGIAGGTAGYRHGGMGEGILGGILGLGLPEATTNPTTLMLAARLLNKAPVLSKTAAAVLGEINSKNQ